MSEFGHNTRWGAFVVLGLLLSAPAPASAQPASDDLDRLPRLDLPTLSDDTLAFGDAFSVGLSSLEFSVYNQMPSQSPQPQAIGSRGGISKVADQSTVFLNGDISLKYTRYKEKKRISYMLGTGLVVKPTLLHSTSANSSGGASTAFALTTSPTVAGEVHFYPARGIDFMLLVGGIVSNIFLLTHQSKSSVDQTDTKNLLFISPSVGLGYGRVLNLGPAVRLRKIIRYLSDRGILSGPLPHEVGNKILLHWYALKNELGYYKHLAYTIKILKSSGLLKKPLTFENAYAVTQMIKDSQLDQRDSGWLVAAVLNIPTDVLDDESTSWLGSFLAANFSRPLGEDQAFTLKGLLHFDFGVLDSRNPWMILSIKPQYSRYLYSDYLDPLGAFQVNATLKLGTSFDGEGTGFLYHSYSDMMVMPLSSEEVSFEIGLGLAYRYFFNRGTSFITSIDGGMTTLPGMDVGYYVMFGVGYTYGIARGYYSRF